MVTAKFVEELKSQVSKTPVHYCKLSVLDAILNEGNLRAVNSNFMNDLSEYKFSSSILQKELEAVTVSNYIPLTVSFAKIPDQIPQWAMYAKEIGIGIQMDFTYFIKQQQHQIFKTLIPPSIRQEYISIDKGSDIDYVECGMNYPLNVLYIKKEERTSLPQNNYFKTFVDAIKKATKEIDPDMPNKLVAFEDYIPFAATFIKEQSFEFEKEARLSTFVLEDFGGEYKPNILFDDKRIYLRPYINLTFVLYGDDGPEKLGWPIHTIWVGPGRTQYKAFESIVKRLELGTLKVFPVPFKNFLDRLIAYLYDALVFVTEPNNKEKKKACKAKAKEIVKGVKATVTDFKLYDSENYHICVSKKNYTTSDYIITHARETLLDVVKETLLEDKASSKLEEFETKNYFSIHGIRVRLSEKAYSFV